MSPAAVDLCAATACCMRPFQVRLSSAARVSGVPRTGRQRMAHKEVFFVVDLIAAEVVTASPCVVVAPQSKRIWLTLRQGLPYFLGGLS